MGKPPPIGHEQFPYVAKNPVSHFFHSVYESGRHKNNHEDNRHPRTTNTQLSILSVARSLPELGGMQRQRRAARETAFTPTEKGLSSPVLARNDGFIDAIFAANNAGVFYIARSRCRA